MKPSAAMASQINADNIDAVKKIIEEADDLQTLKNFKTKEEKYQEAANKGSIVALVRLGDLYRESFSLRSDTVKQYIDKNKVKDLSKLDNTFINNNKSLNYYLQALQAAGNLEGPIKLEVVNGVKKGVLALFSAMQLCHGGLPIAFLTKLPIEKVKTLRKDLNIDVNQYRSHMPVTAQFTSSEKIVNKQHLNDFGFQSETLALIGAKFLGTFIQVTFNHYRDPDKNHNLIEMGSFFLSLVKYYIDRDNNALKMTDTTATQVGKLFLEYKGVILSSNLIDSYELRKEKSPQQHGVFILNKLMTIFLEKPTQDNMGSGLFLIILYNVMVALNIKITGPDYSKDIATTIKEYLSAIKSAEAAQLSAPMSKLSM